MESEVDYTGTAAHVPGSRRVPSGMPARKPALIVPKTLARIPAGNRSCITVRISGLIGAIASPAMMCQAIRNGNTDRRRNTRSLFIKIHLLLKSFQDFLSLSLTNVCFCDNIFLD